MPLIFVPVPLATLLLLAGFRYGTLYLHASWRTGRVIVAANDGGGGHALDGGLEDLGNAHLG